MLAPLFLLISARKGFEELGFIAKLSDNKVLGSR